MPLFNGLSDLNQALDDDIRVTSMAAKSLDQEVLAASLENVGPLNAVAMHIVDCIDSPSVSAKKISFEIGRDPIITAKVLNVANSAFYGGAGSTTLPAAVGRLGLSTLRNLVLASAVSDRQNQTNDRYPYIPNGMWQHSLAVALLAQKNGTQFGSLRGRGNDLFLCGLLHDIGKVITSQILDVDVKSTGFSGLLEESESNGYTHIDAGLLVAKEWNLPETVTNVITFHHDIRKATSDVELVAAVALFDVIANRRSLGLRDDADVDVVLPEGTLDTLLLTEQDYIELDESIEEQVVEINEMVEVLY